MVFNFSAATPDFITVWTGDTGHEYKHRNRTKVDIADTSSRSEPEIEISQQYGTRTTSGPVCGQQIRGAGTAATPPPTAPWSSVIAANDCAD